MSSPPKKELPKLEQTVQEEIQQPKKLHHVEPRESNPLPTAEDVVKEKRESAVLEGIEKFDRGDLSHAETQEKTVLPSKEEFARESTKSAAAGFDHSQLKHVETKVKTVLPDKEEFARETTKSLAASFDHSKLKHVEPTEKHQVEVIADEKKAK